MRSICIFNLLKIRLGEGQINLLMRLCRVFLRLKEALDRLKFRPATEFGHGYERVPIDLVLIDIFTIPAILGTFETRLHSVAECVDDLTIQVRTSIFNDSVCASTCSCHGSDQVYITASA